MQLLPLLAGLLLAACASIGRPDGGPRDVTPPRFVGSNPPLGALNVNRNKIQLHFDENVSLKDVMSKVVVSPAQKNMAVISANGHTINIELRDSLRDSTTYTIDFTDAIVDLNENNPLDGFSFAFSTGPMIDTLCISGMVLEARTLEPAQGIVVGAYSVISDTAVRTLPMERITKTNQLGQFSLRNLAPGTYRVYALNDMNRDYRWDRSEDVAFLDSLITPYVENITVPDTLHTADGSDSIVMRPGVRMMPDDLLLTWFNEGYKAQYLSKYERSERNKLLFEFGAPSDTLPEFEVIYPPEAAGQPLLNFSVLEGSATRDTLTYWLRDSVLIKADTITLAARYLRTDTADQLSWTADTLRLMMRRSKGKTGNNAGNAAGVPSRRNRKGKATGDSVTAPVQEFVKFQLLAASPQKPDRPLLLKLAEPPADFDTAAVHLELMVNDSVGEPVENFRLYCPDSLQPMIWQADMDWQPGATYKLVADSAAWHGIYGNPTDATSQNINVAKTEDFSTLYFNIEGLPDALPAVVELLDKGDNPVAYARVSRGTTRAEFQYITPGTYYARLYLDANDNGVWDTGLLDSIQPEETYYYPRRINLKKNWDLEQTWNIYDTPVDLQKHNDIKKNKPQTKRGTRPEATSDEDEDEDDLFANPFDRNNTGSSRGFGNGLSPATQGTGRLR